ncbi:transglutaminase family protein [Yeosuana sp. AK3]
MPTFYIKHTTLYSYSDSVIDAANQIKLYPINDHYQKVVSLKITVNTNPYIDTYLDFYNNVVGTFMITEPHNVLSIELEAEVITYPRIFPEDTVDASVQWNELKTLQSNPQYIDFLKYKPFSGTADVLEWIQSKDLKVLSPYKVVLELCQYIYNHFNYIKGITHVHSTLDDIWGLKGGVCQDFTNIMLQITRMLGIPARYVSGYICPNNEFTRGEGATHAWIEAYLPNYGWLGIDPTNNAIANENHVALAVGRNYNDCSPVKGVYKGNVKDVLTVNVTVSTSKNFITNHVPISNTLETHDEVNSYRQNLEIIQQHQQQQQ